MALHKVEGVISSVDIRAERIAAGTLGGEHLVPFSVSAARLTSITDDANPDVRYGTFVAGQVIDLSYSTSNLLTQNGTQTILGAGAGADTPNAAASLTFNGTSIGVLLSSNPLAGTARFYIDGIETPGRVAATGTLYPPATGPGTPSVHASDTAITLIGGARGFATGGGRVEINGELIDYTSLVGSTLTGCTRGVGGTVQTDHYMDETVYVWSSFIDMGNLNGFATKQLAYYNNQLQPGDHRIVVVSETGLTTGHARVYLDGFLHGPLLGSANIFNQTETLSVTFGTDANGHCDIAGITTSSADKSLISIIGYTQTNCETSNANVMGKLGLRYQPDGTPFIYCHNGPASSTITFNITLGMLGQSI